MSTVRGRRRRLYQNDHGLIWPFLAATTLHVAVIFGFRFSAPQLRSEASRPLSVILVQEASPKRPVKADFLAQAQLEGASDRHADVTPAAPLPAPTPDRSARVAMVPEPQAEPQPAPPTREQPPVTQFNNAVTEAQDGTEQRQVSERRNIIAVAGPRINSQKATVRKQAAPTNVSTETAQSEARQSVAATDPSRLISNSFAMASLSAELDQRLESRSKRLRQKYVSASTQEYNFATYMDAWRAKVERIGNLNYPDEARQRRLSGTLLLDVCLRPDGSVADITIRRPSGYKELDAAAIRIVKLSAPFAPFPEAIRREVDLLHITRSWQFMHTSKFTTSG